MFRNWFKRRDKLPSARMALAYQAACQQVIAWLQRSVRRWETQPVQRRKLQLIAGLIGLLLLGSVSVYFTATGHFFIRIKQTHYEHDPNVGPLRRNSN
ncbi:hypothetical protein BN8_p06795 (plasmid) [Fibrisoma limi BUZ 3]|uniref:Uncharacterized protein n=1 Tax=Fibrisoma limi BUZ 3 TaxID=1185876 RepID=I2GU00_9BACT|nr:hypothetical protein BN8_p06795 [Fibrisoma limi BUZ 3]